MRINWKVRFKNPWFYVALLGALVIPVLQYFNMDLQEFTTWGAVIEVAKQSASNPYVLGSIIWSVLMFFIDPTTKGVSDSQRALTYIKPKGDK